ncbi:DEAD/DEAH box helicase, partial [Lactobacillus paragasseri]|uniref:DEAD/DEAH box helicase n=1 Tax=Lactobacillus paragasseri TaxID=2107999 RepID=UPI00254F31B6
ADSKTPANERDRIMNDFKSGKIKVLCNCDLISEGFNVPDCSCVVLLRPTESLVVYLQQSMRCMRYQSDKDAIIIDQVGNFIRFGLPNADRDWTLEDRAKHPQREGGSDGP